MMVSETQTYNNAGEQTNIKVKKHGKRKTRYGVVVSKSGNKSFVARIERRFRHPMYGKVIKKYKKVYVHDELNIAKIGDMVEIRESRPISKLKRWNLIKVLGRTHIKEEKKEPVTEIEMVTNLKTE